MGIELVNLLLLRYASRLSGRAFKVLVRMATTALDQPNSKGQPARLYFAGEEPLALVLYGAAETYTPNQVREVRRVVRELKDAGLIEPVVVAGTGRRQAFRLTFDLGGESAPPLGGESGPALGGESAPRRVGDLPTPRTDTGTTEDLSQDSTHPAPTSTTGSPGSRPHEFQPDQWDDGCRHCGETRPHAVHRRQPKAIGA